METIKDIELLEPTKLYSDRLKNAYRNNAEEFFDELAKKANIDIEANKQSVEEFRKLSNNAEEVKKSAEKTKTLKNFLIALGVIAIIACIILIVLGVMKTLNMGLGIALGVVSFAGAIALFVVSKKIVFAKQKMLEEQLAKLQEAAKNKENECYAQMAILNSLYDWNMPAKILTKTVPIIQMDNVFEPSRFQLLHDKYGFDDDDSTDTSSVFVQSGSILGNPFVIEQNYCQTMRNHTYTGTLTIHWVEYRTINGKRTAVSRSQVLTATVNEPEPYYYDSTWLIYGNDAAPRLSFSRSPSDANNMDEKAINKYVKKFDKDLDKMVEKSMKGEKQFVRLQNTEFEALFHALDRDNDVEFRLLFTPLAQKNMVELIKSKVPFGDDFIFRKRQGLNFIHTKHSQIENLYMSSPRTFINYSYEDAKNNFISYCERYLMGLFFDFAPLLSIPLYTQTKTKEYIYKDSYNGRITSYEVESAANAHNVSTFAPDDATTNVILKSEFLHRVDGGDSVNIHAYSFRGEDRLTYVPKMGGDGHMHNVPVHWIEYIPTEKITPFVVQQTESSRNTFLNSNIHDIASKMSTNFSADSDIIYSKKFVSYVPNGTQTLSKSILDSLKNKED